MFPAPKEGEWEPYKIRRREKKPVLQEQPLDPQALSNDGDNADYEEDPVSEDGAVWPMTDGRITNWSCFLALLNHVYNTLNPPFHTPILLITQPCWTQKDHERLTQYFFEKFKMPAFALMDAATATSYAYGLSTATVVDVGFGKADVTAVSEYVIHEQGRASAVSKCGGEAMTQRLLELLNAKKFTREMCEQLKKSGICEILPPGTPLPGTTGASVEGMANPAAAASTGATASGPGHRSTAGALGEVPLGPGPDTEVDIQGQDDDNEGVLDVASIVTSGNMPEYIAKKEKEKADRAAAKKKGSDAAAAAQARQLKLPNSKKDRNTFLYEDHALLDALKDKNLDAQQISDASAVLDEGHARKQNNLEQADGAQQTSNGEPQSATEPTSNVTWPTLNTQTRHSGPIRREIEVGVERFQAAGGGILERIADSVYRTISSVEEINKRSELWDSLIIVGNGAKTRGMYPN